MKTTRQLIAALLFAATPCLWATEPAQESEQATEAAAAPKKESRGKKAAADFVKNMKFSGYIIGKYSIDDKKGDGKDGGFDIRLVRLNLQGDCFDGFGYRIQAEVNGAPGVDKGPRLVDCYIEWKKYDFVQLKLGQYKRPFGFENPTSPLNVGIGDYSQVTKKLTGIGGDRCGEHNSGGRDVGFQVQGNLLRSKRDGHHWLHYQVGVFNGQGINHKDNDRHKDLIGGLWFSPVKALQIGGFGWWGHHTAEKEVTERKSVDRKRWGVGLKYEDKWVVRAEYMNSLGGVIGNPEASTRSDGWYALVGTPKMKGFSVYGKWDAYRDTREWASTINKYCLSANYFLGKHLIFQANYSLTDDRPGADRYYNTFDVQVVARF